MHPIVALIPLMSYSVVDGMTLRSGPVDYVLWGIKAPSAEAPGGAAARGVLQAIAGNQPLTCESKGTTEDNRPLVMCFRPDGIDIACEMLRSGHAQELGDISDGHYSDCRPE